MFVRFLAACVLAASCAGLAGCGALQRLAEAPAPAAKAGPAAPADYVQPVTTAWEGDSLIAQSHVAADGLVANLANRLPQGAGILAATFVDRDNFDQSSSLGRLVSSLFVNRLAQAGYGVTEFRLRGNMGIRVREGEFALSRKTAQYMKMTFDASAMLVGTYTLDQEAVFVSADVVRLEDGRILAAYDFAVPRDGVVRRLLDDGKKDVVFASYLRNRAGGPALGMAGDAFAPLDLRELPLEAPATGAPAQVPGPAEVPGPFRLFPPTGQGGALR
ncbi:FlgO family outer membrane protein [Desulfocurvus sp. DL9XJH121]